MSDMRTNDIPRVGDLEVIDPPESAVDLRRAFVQALHPTGYSDLRAILPKERTETRSVAVGDFAQIDAFAADYAHRNVYIGVATRARLGGRELKDCLSLHALFVDIDFKHFASEAAAWERLRAFPFPPSIIVITGGGLHCYWLLHAPLDLRDGGAAPAKQLLQRLAQALGGDPVSAEPAHILRLPGTLNHKKDYAQPRPVRIEQFDLTRRYAVETLQAVLPQLTAETSKTAAPLPQQIREGNRNDALFKEGCRLRRLGFDQEEICAALTVVNQRRCHPPLADSDIATIAKSCARYPTAERTFPQTEAGDGEFLADLYQDCWRHDHRQGRDLVTDESSGIWVPDPVERLTQMAVHGMRLRQQQAAKVENEDKRKEALKWAINGESRSRIMNALALARSVPPVSDPGDHWDRAPFLLGVQNGVVELDTGRFRLATADDCVTMRVRTAYDPAATCPLWLKTLDGIFAPNDLFDDAESRQLQDFVQRSVGYSATGDCREECCFFTVGGGGNGKSTFVSTVGWLLGDYSDDMPYSTLERSDRGGGIPNDIAKLDGKRFITCAEVNEFTLNEARLKALTGRDPITARFLHQEFFTYTPVAKIWIATNNKPRIVGQDDGIWRRIHLIPFMHSFEGTKDKNNQLKDQLRNELPGILNWVIAGARQWLERGIDAPKTVRDATANYRNESNPLNPFIEACCKVDERCRVQAAQIWRAYQGFMKEIEPMFRLTDKAFHKAMKARFKHEDGRQTFYLGVGLLDTSAGDADDM